MGHPILALTILQKAKVFCGKSFFVRVCESFFVDGVRLMGYKMFHPG